MTLSPQSLLWPPLSSLAWRWGVQSVDGMNWKVFWILLRVTLLWSISRSNPGDQLKVPMSLLDQAVVERGSRRPHCLALLRASHNFWGLNWRAEPGSLLSALPPFFLCDTLLQDGVEEFYSSKQWGVVRIEHQLASLYMSFDA